MKIFPVSDLHIEFHRDAGVGFIQSLPVDCDVLVIAGDVAPVHYLVFEKSIVELCDKFPEVVFVAGNHEYYRATFPGIFQDIDNRLRELESKIDNFTWLENKRVEIGGQYFIGCTLWFEENPESKNPMNKQMLNDFDMIENCDPIAFLRCDESMRFLKNNIQEGDIVVTHHMPSYDCVAHKYKFNRLNCYFATEMKDVILDTKPAYWIFGHTHIPTRLKIGDTDMVCNPLGYAHECNKNFDYNLILEV